jgi:ferrous iron transport protein A
MGSMNPRARLLTDAAVGEQATVAAVSVPAGLDAWAQQLQDLGFMPGERVMLMSRGRSAAAPLVVRVGLSTYALRSAEAACVQVNG